MTDDDKYWAQLEYAERRLNEARSRGDKQAEGDAGIFVGNSYACLDQMSEAITAFEQAIPLYRETHSSDETGKVLLQLGSFLLQAERFSQALSVLEEALAIAKEVEDGQAVLECLRRLGVASTEAGQPQKAISYHQEALTILRINGDRETEMHELGNLGGAYAKLRSAREALACHQQALLIAREFDDVESQALELGNLGYTYTEMLEQPEVGIDYFEQALTIFRVHSDQYNEAKTLGNVGGALWKLERSQEALQAFEQARSIAANLGDRGLLGGISSKIGIIYNALGQPDEALRLHQRALLLDQGRGDRQAEGVHLNSLGLLRREGGNPEEALKLHEKALVLARERKDRLDEARQIGNIAGDLTALGRAEEGFFQNKHAVAIFQEVGDILGEARCYVNIGANYVDMGIVYTNTGITYGVRGNKGKALAYWRMGQTLLQIINKPEAEVAQGKIDALRDMVNEETYRRLWQTSEVYVRWLSFQRHWITKETSIVKGKNDDLTKYSKNLEDETLHTLSDKLSSQAWLQGDIAVQEEKWQEAQAYYQEALSIVCKQEQSKAQALLWGNLGYCYAAIKNFDEAITCFQKSLNLFHSLDDTQNELKTQLNLGILLLQTGLIKEARSHLDEALDCADMLDVEDPLLESIALRKRSEAYRMYNETRDAKRFLSYALDAARACGDQREEGKVLTDLGLTCLELGYAQKARSYFQQALDLYHDLSERHCEGEQWCYLAIVYAIIGKFDKSREHFIQAQKLFHEQSDQINDGQMSIYIGVTHSLQGELAPFLAYLRRGRNLVEQDRYVQERIKYMIEQLARSMDHETYQTIWRESDQYYQALC